ncbi:MAG: putative membrane protein YeaQ/YmgE (transglycosylase-associated protein family) [Saprospiraceae bacterium]|jgi:uncharacterized membrane protein YeaQ/YmgE (transglycosylase-associated protein family)
MNLLSWLLIGLLAGSVAKMITPQKEGGGWLSSLGIGIAGSFVGGFLAGLIGIASHGILGSLLIALGGSVLVLFLYHRFWNK